MCTRACAERMGVGKCEQNDEAPSTASAASPATVVRPVCAPSPPLSPCAPTNTQQGERGERKRGKRAVGTEARADGTNIIVFGGRKHIQNKCVAHLTSCPHHLGPELAVGVVVRSSAMPRHPSGIRSGSFPPSSRSFRSTACIAGTVPVAESVLRPPFPMVFHQVSVVHA